MSFLLNVIVKLFYMTMYKLMNYYINKTHECYKGYIVVGNFFHTRMQPNY